jgi:hypothetical protein
MLVKPWPPVKPMDPRWLEAYGNAAHHLSPVDMARITKALNEYAESSDANAEALNNVLLDIVPISPEKESLK